MSLSYVKVTRGQLTLVCVTLIVSVLLVQLVSCSSASSLLRQKRQATGNKRPAGGSASLSVGANANTGGEAQLPTKVITGDAASTAAAATQDGRPQKAGAGSSVGGAVAVPGDDTDVDDASTGGEGQAEVSREPAIRPPKKPSRRKRPSKKPKTTTTQATDEDEYEDEADDRCDSYHDDDYDDYPSNPFAGKIHYFKSLMNNAFDYMPGGHFYGGDLSLGRGFSSGASASAIANSDGSSRLASSVRRNGRTRGIVSETRNGRTKTRRIGGNEEYDDEEE